MKIRIAAAAFCAALCARSASAQYIIASGTGINNPASLLTFETHPANHFYEPLGNYFAAQGVTFSGNVYLEGTIFQNAGGGAKSAGNTDNPNAPFCSACTHPVDVFFTNDTYGAALQFLSFQYPAGGGSTVFTAYLNGNQVSSFSTANSTAGLTNPLLYGFDSSVLLDQIRIDGGNNNTSVVFDNIQYDGQPLQQVTPEPASLVLMATGLVGIVAIARNRRRV